MAAPSSSTEKKDGGAGTMIALLVALLMLAMMWPVYRPHFARMVVGVAVAESRLLLAFEPLLTERYAGELRAVVVRGTPLLKSRGVARFKPMTGAQIAKVWNIPSRAFVPFSILALLLAAWHIRDTDVAARHRRRFNLEQLIRFQAQFYPHLRPLMDLRLDQTDPRKGPWRVKYTYIEFAITHQLLRDALGKLVTDESYPFKAAYFDSEKARRVFTAQLGKRWTNNLEDLLPHERAMFGVLAAMASADPAYPKTRADMLQATRLMNMTWKMRAGKDGRHSFELDTSIGEALARKYWDTPVVRRSRLQHGYFTTVMSELASHKRRSGELCISHYLWLRPTDPTLFYTLHQEGLELPNLEAAGPFVHYQLEKRAGMALAEGQIEKAVDALKLALVEEGWLAAGAREGTQTDPGSVKDWRGVVPAAQAA